MCLLLLYFVERKEFTGDPVVEDFLELLRHLDKSLLLKLKEVTSALCLYRKFAIDFLSDCQYVKILVFIEIIFTAQRIVAVVSGEPPPLSFVLLLLHFCLLVQNLERNVSQSKVFSF